MKTIKQILKKVDTLKRKLRKKQIRENFGDKEQRELEEFIGDVYAYDYYDRLAVQGVISDFFNWCINYTGNSRLTKSILD